MTYCLHIFTLLINKVPDLILKETHYTSDSLISEVMLNNQEYTIEIKPKAKECWRICTECGRIF